MFLTEKIKATLIKNVLEKGIFDVKRLMKIDADHGIIQVEGVRTIIFGVGDFAVLHIAAEKLAGYAGLGILRTQGEEAGKIEAQITWQKGLKNFKLKYDIPTIFSVFPAVLTFFGWGKVNISKINKETGEGTIIIENCFEADGILERYGKKEISQCYFVTGYLKGFLSETFGKKLKVTETQCKAAGADHCEFQIIAA